MRILVGVLVGALVAVLCVFAVESVGHLIFPPPPGLDPNKPEDLARIMAVIPPAALAFVLLAWFFGALAGAWTADRIARRALAGWIVAALLVVGAVATMIMIPHPAWMWAGGLLLPPAAAWLAQRLTAVPA